MSCLLREIVGSIGTSLWQRNHCLSSEGGEGVDYIMFWSFSVIAVTAEVTMGRGLKPNPCW